MAVIGWGKPTIAIGQRGASNAAPSRWSVIDYVKENTTSLNVTKGEKKEARIEGGEAEAVKYGANSYEFSFEVRDAVGRPLPFTAVNGIVSGEWAVVMQPEDATATGLQMDNCVLSVEESFSSEDGLVYKITASVLKPASGDIVKKKVIANIKAPTL